MPWQELTKGRFERKIGENELFIKGIGDRSHPTGREHWSVTAGATFRLSRSLSALELDSSCRNAWRLLRFQHPNIACTASNDMLTYTVPDRDALQEWEHESFMFPLCHGTLQGEPELTGITWNVPSVCSNFQFTSFNSPQSPYLHYTASFFLRKNFIKIIIK